MAKQMETRQVCNFVQHMHAAVDSHVLGLYWVYFCECIYVYVSMWVKIYAS